MGRQKCSARPGEGGQEVFGAEEAMENGPVVERRLSVLENFVAVKYSVGRRIFITQR